MRNINFKKVFAVGVLSVVGILGVSEASAQSNKNVYKQQEKIRKQQQKIDRKQDRLDDRRDRVQAQRYRVYRNGSYYNTDNRGADLLRQAVNRGYQQGLTAGRNDRSNRRGMSWRNSSVYRNGNYGYQSYVDSAQYRYYFQQGFERGYQDGYNSRYQYGSNNNGTFNILGNILSGILNLQQY